MASDRTHETVATVASLLRRSVPRTERNIDLQDVNQLFTGEPTQGRRRMLLQDLVDFFANARRVTLCVLRPGGGDAIELEAGVLQRDVGVESRAGRGHQIAGDVRQI